MGIVKKLEAEAENQDGNTIEIINMDLYMGVTTRPTEHKFWFGPDPTPEFRDFVMSEIESDSAVTGTIDGDLIHLQSTA